MHITEIYIQNLLSLTEKASKAIMSIYNSDTTIVEYKPDHSPLTQADKLSHNIIVNGLKKLFPLIPVLSEEGNLDEIAQLVASPTFWLVDPIDGTQEFVNRNGEFCIAIGLIENNKPVFGFVSAPTLNTVYYGGLGFGSFKKVGHSEPVSIHVKNLNPHIVAVSRSHPSEETLQFLEELVPDAEQKPLGSMLKQMELAEGKVDIYASIDQPLKLWDTAAGNAIIEGAGGYMTRTDGAPLDYNNPNLLVGDFLARAIAELK
jgi:3'(2'), 5'-bisphosphate nucleotidase